jgi:hypothetical protein
VSRSNQKFADRLIPTAGELLVQDTSVDLPHAVLSLAEQLEASPAGAAMRGTRGLYPTVNTVHLLGVVLLVGAVGVVDARVLGLGRAVPLPALSRYLTPAAVAGLVLLTVSGVLLYAADATPFTRSPLFQAKLVLIGLGVINAWAFRWRFGDFEDGLEPAPTARVMAAASLGLWTSATVVGRWLAYL